MADYNDKHGVGKETVEPHHGGFGSSVDEEVGVVNTEHKLNRDLKSRHMQMIAIGTMYSNPSLLFHRQYCNPTHHRTNAQF